VRQPQLLPAHQRHPRADGRVHDQDLQPAVGPARRRRVRPRFCTEAPSRSTESRSDPGLRVRGQDLQPAVTPAPRPPG
jgi:hypothetical protein